MSDVESTFVRLKDLLRKQQNKVKSVDSWLRPELERGFEVPRTATKEHRALADLSRTPWLRLVVDNVVQAMYVDSIVTENGPSDRLWALWNANGLAKGQIANHRTMIAYGHSYGVVQPAAGEYPRTRFVSPNRMSVEFDAIGDPYPSAALEVMSTGKPKDRYKLRLPGVELLVEDGDGDPKNGIPRGMQVVQESETGLAYVPVVMFANQEDLDGNVIGEVEPFIPSAQRINKTSYDRLLAQHFNSWKVKTATGLELPSQVDEDGDPIEAVDEDAAEKLKIKLSQEDILIGEDPDTKFGTLDATALDPFVASWRADIEALAAVSQTPAHALTGQLVNLGPDALASARSPLTQKVYERQMNAGEGYSRLLRCAAQVAGWDDLAADDMVRSTWQDMEIRSMAQAVDALGKAATMLKIPATGLWHLIPGVEASDVLEWQRLADEEYERDPLHASFNRQVESTVSEVDGGIDG